MIADFQVGGIFGCLNAFVSSLDHVLVAFLLEVDKHAILARELQLSEVLRDHLLRLYRMIVFLVRNESADRLLCLINL